jgi:phospholipid transport system substrate-binding protein
MLLTVTVLGALSAAPSAIAAESAGGFVRARQAQVTTLLHQPEGPNRERQISQVLDSMLDYQELARRSLAQHWGERSEKERSDFTNVLKQLVRRSYERNLKNILEYQVEYLGEDATGDGVVVHTRAVGRSKGDGDPVNIDYEMSKLGDAWRVHDIVTEGSSLVNNYRNQFNRIIRKEGYPALYDRMQKKLGTNTDDTANVKE